MIEAVPACPMRAGPEIALPPPLRRAWADFLARHPDQDALAPQTVPFTGRLLRDAGTVNRAVNAWRYRREARDYWYIPTFAPDGWPELRADGFDCEDQALTKRMILARDHRIPLGALRLALCWAGATFHAVLLICTTRGELVMDNGLVTGFVVPWDRFRVGWFCRWAGRGTWETIFTPGE
jgi:predicted transglutaminase-like cysteine proteinase